MSPFIRDTLEATAQAPVFSERDALKLVAAPLASLRAAPAEDQVAFLFEAFGGTPGGASLGFVLALKAMSAAVLRGGLELNSVQSVRLVETATVYHEWFPHKALLTALARCRERSR